MRTLSMHTLRHFTLARCKMFTDRISSDHQFYFRHVTFLDIVDAISSVHSNALGPDGIPLRHLKDCMPVIMRPLISIFYLSMQTGIFPTNKKCLSDPDDGFTQGWPLDPIQIAWVLFSLMISPLVGAHCEMFAISLFTFSIMFSTCEICPLR